MNYCEDCVHCEPWTMGEAGVRGYKCIHPSADPLTEDGAPVTRERTIARLTPLMCKKARQVSMPCGPGGSLFEAREEAKEED